MARDGCANPGRVGQAAESKALRFLKRRGLKLVERNFRDRLGEIDLVMQDGDCLVFVEVRMRTATQFGSAIESVGSFKQARLVHAAKRFLQLRRVGGEVACRFDVVGIDRQATGKEHIDWRRDAFWME